MKIQPILNNNLVLFFDKYRNEVLFFIAAFAVYWTIGHHSPLQNTHYVYLANAFLQGSLSVEDPQHLIEVVRVKGGNYFAYGVMPAVVLLPFVAIWGLAVNQALIVAIMGAANVALMYHVLQKIECQKKVGVWLTVLFAFGTVHFHAVTWATTWFFMHVTGVFFLLLAINEVLGKNRGIFVGLLLGAAVLSRNAILLTAPFFLLLMNRGDFSVLRNLHFASGLLFCLTLNGLYNFARFESFFDNGYGRIFSKPHGMFSVRYLRHNLYTYLAAPPEYITAFPYLRPSLHGMGLFFTTPAFIFIFKALRRSAIALGSWLAVAGVGSLYLLYFWSGFAQFGVRYTLDFTPFLVILTAIGFGSFLQFPRIPLVVLSVLINLWGVLWWRLGGLNIIP